MASAATSEGSGSAFLGDVHYFLLRADLQKTLKPSQETGSGPLSPPSPAWDLQMAWWGTDEAIVAKKSGLGLHPLRLVGSTDMMGGNGTSPDHIWLQI